MKVIRLFIASSIEEFKNERIFIGDFIRRLNDRLVSKAYQIRLFLCEDESDNCQSDYNREIENSNIFIALVGTRLGPYTFDEIKLARDSKINKRILVFNSTESKALVPDEIKSSFEVKIFDNCFLTQVYGLIEKESESLLPDIEDKTILPSTISKIVIPGNDDTLETAIIGNIIRGFNDQHEGELSIEASEAIIAQKYDAYVTLLSDGFDSEIRRTQDLLDANTAIEMLWVFSNRNPNRNPDVARVIAALMERLKYAEEYGTYDELALKFKCLLMTKALNIVVGMKIFDQFEYVVEDHLLKRSLKSGNKYIVKNLASISDDPETQRRKENTIKNLLNLYHSTEQKFEKYKEALTALHDSNFSYFVYESSEDVRNLPIKQHEAYQVVIDYVMDRIESLHRRASNLTEDEIKIELDKIVVFLKESKCLIEVKDEFWIDSEVSTILFDQCSLLNDETEQYLEKALQSFQTMPSTTMTQKDKALKCVLRLCKIKEIKNKDKEWKYWIDYGFNCIEDISADLNHEIRSSFLHEYGFLLNIYKARAIRNDDDRGNREKYFEKAKIELEEIGYNKDNNALHYYIQLRFEGLINDIMLGSNIDECVKEVYALYDNYQKYLSFSDDYLLERSYLHILIAYLEQNALLWKDAVRAIVDNKLIRPDDNTFLDVFYIGSEMYKTMDLYKDSILLLNDLIVGYPGDMDKAICLKSRGSCYEELLEERGALCQAEKDFKASLKLFRRTKKKRYSGYVLDDLAFCSILLKKYAKAEAYAKKAIAVKEYDATNKYGNYISALMCQDRFDEAQQFYFSFNKDERGRIKEGLIKDWEPNDYMSRVGIDTSNFNKLFLDSDV